MRSRLMMRFVRADITWGASPDADERFVLVPDHVADVLRGRDGQTGMISAFAQLILSPTVGPGRTTSVSYLASHNFDESLSPPTDRDSQK
jgi:hypothetical protein